MPSAEDIRRAQAGDKPALGRVVVALQPTVHVGVASVLAAIGPHLPRDPRQECMDLVQGFLLDKLIGDPRVLRDYDPARGPIGPYVHRIAQRYAYSKLRLRRVRHELPTAPLSIERPSEGDAHAQVDARDTLDRMLELVEAQLDERGALLFMLDAVEQRSVAEICDHVGITPGALYSWRSRLKDFIGRVKEQLS
jgi:DNA-directed RNA polymerase specialized sigma24 family protein